MSVHDTHGERLLDCPTCGLPAEITDRFILDSTDGPLEHVKLVCPARHWYTPPIDSLPTPRRNSAPAPPCRVGGIAKGIERELLRPAADHREGHLNQEIRR